MARVSTHRRIITAVAALAAGCVVGYLVRPAESADSKIHKSDSALLKSGNSTTDTGASRPDLRVHRQREESDFITFSAQQWSILMRHRELLSLPVTDCFKKPDAQVSRNILTIDELLENEEQNLNLKGLPAFFGWDEKTTQKIRNALSEFGDNLMSAEVRDASVSYPEDGAVLFNFSDSHEKREALSDQLQSELKEILGERDAERFIMVSQMEGLATPLKGTLRFKGDVVFVNTFGSNGTQRQPPLSEIDRRFRHLFDKIDWSRIKPSK